MGQVLKISMKEECKISQIISYIDYMLIWYFGYTGLNNIKFTCFFLGFLMWLQM